MSATQTKALIERAIARLTEQVPSLAQLKLVARLELRSHGGDAPIWRVEVPGPKVTRDPAGDARIDITVARSHFNELAEEGTLKQWATAFEQGHVRVTGDAAVTRLLANVIQRRLARA